MSAAEAVTDGQIAVALLSALQRTKPHGDVEPSAVIDTTIWILTYEDRLLDPNMQPEERYECVARIRNCIQDWYRRGIVRREHRNPEAAYTRDLYSVTLTDLEGDAVNTGLLDSIEWLEADRYVEAVRSGCDGNLDDVTALYLRESKHAFDDGLWLSCAVTLGAASERAIHRLIESLTAFVDDPDFTTKFDPSKSISKQFSEALERIADRGFKGMVKQECGGAPEGAEAILYDEPHRLRILFDIYRVNRNEAAHPTGLVPTRAELLAYLESFGIYAQMVSGFCSLLDRLSGSRRPVNQNDYQMRGDD